MKDFKRKVTVFCLSLVMILGIMVPTGVVKADSSLAIAQYITQTGEWAGDAHSYNGTYKGTWKASIPLATVMEPFESQMQAFGDKFPWSDILTESSASIYYNVTFPKGVTVGKETHNSSSAMVPNDTIITNLDSDNIYHLKFKLADVNWAGILNAYNADKAAGVENRKITVDIPYSFKATSLSEAQTLEKQIISSSGEFKFYASGSMREFGIGLKKYSSDTASKESGSGAATSPIFSPKNLDSVQATMQLKADLKLGDNTGTSAITVAKKDPMNLVGVLDVSPIKQQMAGFEATFGTNNQIDLTNLKSSFTAKLTLPTGLKFSGTKATLTGAGDLFEIASATVSGNEATVVMNIKNPESITTFALLKEKVNSAANELMVNFNSVSFETSASPATDYKITGSITGNMNARATVSTNGNPTSAKDFNLTWNGEQDSAKQYANDAPVISLVVNYPTPTEKTITESGELDGDLLINGDTQHEKVLKLNKTDKFTVTGLLNVKPIKETVSLLQQQYLQNGSPTGVKVEDVTTGFTATMTLPTGLKFSSTVPTKVTLDGANGKFKITEATFSGKTVTVKMTVVGETPTFQEILDAVTGVSDDLKVNIPDVTFEDSAARNSVQTIKGEVSGNFSAKATKLDSGNIMNFEYTWNGVQKQGLEDSTTPGAETITASVLHDTPTVTNMVAEDNLDGDLKVNGDTQHTAVYEAKKNEVMKLQGVLNVKPIQDKLLAIESHFNQNRAPMDISVSDVETSFTATMTLPAEMKYSDNYSVELLGANGKFEITNTSLNGNELTATMKVVGDTTKYQTIRDAVLGVSENLVVEVNGIKFADTAQPDTNYTITGTVSGNFKGLATNEVSGNKVNFDLKWKGTQLDGGEDSTNPTTNDITLTAKYTKPVEASYEKTEKLPGDILVGKDTEHDAVYTTKKDALVSLTGSLDVSSVKKQMRDIQNLYNKQDDQAEEILISNYKSEFIATLTLPEEMDFVENPSISLLNDNGKYKIVSSKVEGKKVTVVMTLSKDVKTFKDLQDAVLGMEDKLNVVVSGAKFNEKSKAETNYTIKGTMTGHLVAKATMALSGNSINFDLKWEAEQLAGGEDALYPNSKEISFSLKHEPVPTVVTPVAPEKEVKNPDTSDSHNVVASAIVLLMAVVVIVGARKLGKNN